MNSKDHLKSAYAEVVKAMEEDEGHLAMHARIIYNAAISLAEIANEAVRERLYDPWPKLPAVQPTQVKLTKICPSCGDIATIEGTDLCSRCQHEWESKLNHTDMGETGEFGPQNPHGLKPKYSDTL